MCETCPAHILGPGEVAGKVARSRIGRKAAVGFCYLMFPFAVWNELHWWTLAVVALVAAATAAGWAMVRILHRHALVVAPPSLQHRVALPAAEPRRAITRPRRALPAAAKALPAPASVVTGTVLPAPVPVKRPAR